ncbi:GNAT family N-acetyltransferase [Rhodococcoides kyotonense]|uniref:Phosphinothricin acetyltransferase n=1 Tax=Rhodococcoides kyotonense TaxID=398843 RepID=A0A239M744_9NOCA|nr:GNAT family N-acetyltransferase [Rhodococcus kyotonensis]SNT38270.1 phosphinothricin acetyltransferase [Rhodococcus kyotonensis]
MLIRDTVTEDLPSILEIHNDAIRNTTAIWDETEVGLDERMEWLDGRLRAGYPVLTAVVDGNVAGYASYSQWRPKSGYRLTMEHSVYVHNGFHRRGIASALLTELIERARGAEVHALVGVIESLNTTSIALHEKFGFVTVGEMPEVGIKFDRWLDLTLMQLTL